MGWLVLGMVGLLFLVMGMLRHVKHHNGLAGRKSQGGR
jgi:hypothetical protein